MLAGVAALLVWTWFVCYPVPWMLALTLYRVGNPPISADAVAVFAEEMGTDDPAEIEAFVLNKIRYQYDWLTYGHPWYFPTPEQVVEKRQGDCKSRFVVLASVLELKGIPYQQRFNFLHFWVDYDGKTSNELEAPDLSLISRDESGAVQFSRARTDWAELGRTMKEAGWDSMPAVRKVILLSGWFVIVGISGCRMRMVKKRR